MSELEVHGGKRGLILLVDDDPAHRDLACSALEAEGHDVVASGHGREGLDQVARITPDMIASGIDMPVMNGLEFLAALRTSDGTHAIPFIFLTSQAETTQIVEELALACFEDATEGRPGDRMGRAHAAEVVKQAAGLLQARGASVPQALRGVLVLPAFSLLTYPSCGFGASSTESRVVM
jgi:CheY-like chemotaxis protein